MITALTGIVKRAGPAQVYMDTGPIEYEVFVSLDLLSSLQKSLQEKDSDSLRLTLKIYHHFREHEQKLFGFLKEQQREFFCHLLQLRGLGPGLALSLMSHLSMEGFLEYCQSNNTQALSRIPRIGKRTAESLVFEVKQHKAKWESFMLPEEETGQRAHQLTRHKDLALQALLQLGYREQEAQKALRQAEQDNKALDKENVAEWIRLALRNI